MADLKPRLFLRRFELVMIFAIPYAVLYSIALSNAIILALFLLSLRKCRNFLSLLSLNSGFTIGFFFLGLISLLYSANWKTGVALLETRLPLVMVPFFMYSKSSLSARFRQEFQKHFVYSLLATFFLLTSIAVIRNINGQGPDIWFNKWYYHYTDFTEPIGIDPLYLGLFVCWGVLLVLFSMEGICVLFSKTTSRLLFCLFCLFLVMIAARSLIVILLVIIIAFYVSLTFRTADKKHMITTGVVLFLITALSFLLPVTRERFEMLYKGSYSFSSFTMDRLIIWSTAVDAVRENPTQYILGYGAGSSETVMAWAYSRRKIEWDFEKKVDTHNQYLHLLNESGVIALLIFVCWAGVILLDAVRNRNWLLLIFTTLLVSAIFFENYLNRQKGVVFFSMFYAIYAMPMLGKRDFSK